MSKFESPPDQDSNNPELSPAEARADVNAGKELEGGLTPEELRKPETEEVGQEALEKQEELISQRERERLIREEKEKILQEKLDELFKEFEELRELNPRDFESIFESGKTLEGRIVESKSMGFLDQEVARSLAKAFREGIRLLPKILEALPRLLEKFDEDLTKEATERVDEKLKEEKQQMEEGEKKEERPEEPRSEEKPEIPEGEISPGEVKPGPSPIEGGSIETPKA